MPGVFFIVGRHWGLCTDLFVCFYSLFDWATFWTYPRVFRRWWSWCV